MIKYERSEKFENCLIVSSVICCAENITSNASGTTYVWPETPVGGFATFNCPLSPGFTVERGCGNGGDWQLFDELGCGVVNEQLNRLETLFTDVG